MNIQFDKNQLLTIHDPNLPQLKSYRYLLENYQIESQDTLIFTYQKRARKLINLKNLGDGMQVVFSTKTPIDISNISLKRQEILNTLSLFQGFNEETGVKYHFLPFSNGNLENIEKLLNILDHGEIKIEKNKSGTVITGLKNIFRFPENLEEELSFLFALVLIYGKFEGKATNLKSAKIHLPLLGIQTILEEKLIELCKNLQKIGLFIKWNSNIHAEKKIFQLQINDFELLNLFARWNSCLKNQPERNTELITEQNQSIKNELISFIQELQTPELSNKEQFLPTLKNQTLKFLKY